MTHVANDRDLHGPSASNGATMPLAATGRWRTTSRARRLPVRRRIHRADPSALRPRTFLSRRAPAERSTAPRICHPPAVEPSQRPYAGSLRLNQLDSAAGPVDMHQLVPGFAVRAVEAPPPVLLMGPDLPTREHGAAVNVFADERHGSLRSYLSEILACPSAVNHRHPHECRAGDQGRAQKPFARRARRSTRRSQTSRRSG